jgi:isoquinoline 1-oxidoreductase alpha subunit
MLYTLQVNGKPQRVDVDSDTPLLWVLRDAIGLIGTKYGCGIGECGACMVHIDGKAAHSCQTKVSEIGSAKITTIEAVGETEIGARLQKAWVEVDVPQCGYCQAGQIMSAAALLAEVKSPNDETIAGVMNGNLCRCATYLRIREAIKRAAGA